MTVLVTLQMNLPTEIAVWSVGGIILVLSIITVSLIREPILKKSKKGQSFRQSMIATLSIMNLNESASG
jgi:hypothetical protein